MAPLLQDEKKQQWKPKTSTSWVLNHRISTNEIQLRMFEGGKEIIHADIPVENIIFFSFSKYFPATKSVWGTPGRILYEPKKNHVVSNDLCMSREAFYVSQSG